MEPSKLDFAEDAARLNFESRVANAAAIRREAHSLLLLLLGGAGAALSFWLTGSRAVGTGLPFVAFCISTYLFSLAGMLTLFGLRFRDFPALGNEPNNLLADNARSLEDLRLAELLGIQNRIRVAAKFNKFNSVVVNCSGLATAATPLIALIAWYFS